MTLPTFATGFGESSLYSISQLMTSDASRGHVQIPKWVSRLFHPGQHLGWHLIVACGNRNSLSLLPKPDYEDPGRAAERRFCDGCLVKSSSEVATVGVLLAESWLRFPSGSSSTSLSLRRRREGGSIMSKVQVLYGDQEALLPRRSRLLAKSLGRKTDWSDARQPLFGSGGAVE